MAAPILVKTKGRLLFAKNCCKETQQT